MKVFSLIYSLFEFWIGVEIWLLSYNYVILVSQIITSGNFIKKMIVADTKEYGINILPMVNGLHL